MMCCSITAGTQGFLSFLLSWYIAVKEGFKAIHQEKKSYSIEVEADSTITPEVKYIKLEQTEKDGYGIKEILYHNASCFT